MTSELSQVGSSDLYRSVLSQYSPSVLRGIRDHLDLARTGQSVGYLVKATEEYLREPARRASALAELPGELRPVLALLPHVPATGWHVEEMRELLRYLGCRVPDRAIRALLSLGFLALHAYP